MKKVIFLLLILFSVSVVFAATDVAVVNSVVGKVEVQINESWVQLKNGDILTSGSVISTGFKSSAVLYIGQSLIEVRALTRLTIEEIIEQNQNYNTTMFLDAGNIKADIKKSENKRVGFKVRTSVATASVRGTSGEIYSDGTLVCLSGKWAITPPEPKGMKSSRTKVQNENKSEEQTETQISETTETEENIEVTENSETAEENADQDFYDAIEGGAFIVTQDQIITINSDGKIIPPHEVSHTQATSTGGIQSTEVLENDSDLRISTPSQTKEVTNKGKNTASVDISISIQ
jgi:hypothetical protein